jgi:uncharacterized repeat protein (TIGR01451 family)
MHSLYIKLDENLLKPLVKLSQSLLVFVKFYQFNALLVGCALNVFDRFQVETEFSCMFGRCSVRLVRCVLVSLLIAVQIVFVTRPAHAVVVTFNTAASVGTWTVPAGVTRIQIAIRGADGGIGTLAGGNAGGAGANGSVIFNVTPGDTLRYVVGEAGLQGDYEAGGGGGTGVFINNTLVLVAGGGGGEDNTGNGIGGSASTSTTTVNGTAGLTAANGGSAGVGGNPGGAGNNGGIIAPVGDGGGGGGGVNAAGVCFTGVGGSTICGGGQADTNLADGLTVSLGGTGNENSGTGAGDGLSANGGRGFGGGGAGGHRESGGGGGYSGGGGGGSGGSPGGGGSYVNNLFAGYVSGTIAAGVTGGGNALNGSVTISYTTLQLRKISINNARTFTFTSNNTAYSPGPITTTASNVAQTNAPLPLLANTVITEAALPGGWALTALNCTGLGGGAAAYNLGARTVTLTNPAVNMGNDIVCTFTNTYTGPALLIQKTANTPGPVNVGQVITYTYVVTNPSTITINNVGVNDVHNGYGIDPVPSSPVLTDNTPTGNSPDTNAAANVWGTLAGGDVLTFTATYTVTQSDIDLLQ